ncbi:MAG: SRPBCC family protein [Trichodesmium sp. St19_bin2]|nr:SRPBCC family protein [Trichodesmium sp. MAG_R01]MDE5069586.1 SRPBCC family protein [Trichodesmium sp. St4_bin8_1]MDE5072157.1 SRPBCC family protein [Trichodesmium sp. St5_bin8]MDE5091503.1 SRPBCC family protein [Trichodesmium sp. St18_bin3_1_1]MDE5103691.1 SRPBCC family protein [Trichodesmium sp. St19_bin2]
MVKVFISSVINAHIDQAWMKTRNFNSLPRWHPVVATSFIEDDKVADQVGCVRSVNFTEGGSIREKLLVLSDLNYLYSYSILESSIPLRNYVATLQFKPITDGDLTYAEWTSTFDCDPQEEKNLIKLLSDIYQTGFNSLKEIFQN